ncbi:Tmem252 [Columba livia]|nr:Tmem252 [Columba livia]
MESLQPCVRILALKFGLTPKQDFREHWLMEPKHLLDDGNLLQQGINSGVLDHKHRFYLLYEAIKTKLIATGAVEAFEPPCCCRSGCILACKENRDPFQRAEETPAEQASGFEAGAEVLTSTVTQSWVCHSWMSKSTFLEKQWEPVLTFQEHAALGLFLLVAGIFWNTFHEVLKCRVLSSIFIQNPSHRELRISTIDRPDFYPPSYEDSTDPEKQSSVLPVDSTIKQEEIINIPPPPYSESSAELISETDEQEQPPPYELSVQWLQQQQTADQRSNLRRTESNFNPSTQENSYQQDTDCQGISERATPVRTSETGSG